MKLLFGLVIWVISILIFGVPLGIFKIYKIILDAITTGQRTKEGEEWFPLSANDAVCAPDASWVKSDINVGFVLKLKPNCEAHHLNVQQLRNHFSNVFLDKTMKGGKYEKLCSYIALKGGYAFRVHTNYIDLDQHILELKWNKHYQEKYQCLENFLSKWITRKWEERKPCWEMILIQDLQPPGVPCTQANLFLAFKIHHALADGYSLFHILDVLTGNTSPYLVRDFKETNFFKVRQMLECPNYLDRLKGFPPDENPFRVHLTDSNRNKYVFSFTSFPLDGIKEIRRRHGVHVASVLFAITIGALRKYAEKDLLGKKIPNEIGIITSLPWPRHPSRIQNNRNVDKICNHWTYGSGTVSFDEKDPVKRMKEIENELETFKEFGLDKLQNRILIPAISALPSSLVHRFYSSDKGYGVCVTSLVGGNNYSLMGSKAERILPIAGGSDLSPYIPVLCFTFTHSGLIEMLVRFQPSVIRDQETANMISQKFCLEEFNALLKA